MLTLTNLDIGLRPYGFIRLDYGRTWTTGGVSFIGGEMVVLKATSQDIVAVAKMFKDGLIAENNAEWQKEKK